MPSPVVKPELLFSGAPASMAEPFPVSNRSTSTAAGPPIRKNEFPPPSSASVPDFRSNPYPPIKRNATIAPYHTAPTAEAVPSSVSYTSAPAFMSNPYPPINPGFMGTAISKAPIVAVAPSSSSLAIDPVLRREPYPTFNREIAAAMKRQMLNEKKELSSSPSSNAAVLGGKPINLTEPAATTAGQPPVVKKEPPSAVVSSVPASNGGSHPDTSSDAAPIAKAEPVPADPKPAALTPAAPASKPAGRQVPPPRRGQQVNPLSKSGVPSVKQTSIGTSSGPGVRLPPQGPFPDLSGPPPSPVQPPKAIQGKSTALKSIQGKSVPPKSIQGKSTAPKSIQGKSAPPKSIQAISVPPKAAPLVPPPGQQNPPHTQPHHTPGRTPVSAKTRPPEGGGSVRPNSEIGNACRYLHPNLSIPEALEKYEEMRIASIGTSHQLPANIAKYRRSILSQKREEKKMEEQAMGNSKQPESEKTPQHSKPAKSRKSGKSKKQANGKAEAWKYQLVPRESTRRAIIAEFEAKNNGEEPCFTTRPVEDEYEFVPRGNVYITRTARKLTKEAGEKVYTVRKLSQAIGIQVPKEIYAKAVQYELMTREDRGYVLELRDKREKREAMLCLYGMFEQMPLEERETIVNKAFEKSSGRVGRRQKVCLPERLRRATIAHLRHNHADYESRLMKEAEARISMARGYDPMQAESRRRMEAERRRARSMVSTKITEIYQGWEPCTNRNPWDSLEKLAKKEFLKKGKAKERLARGRGEDDESDDEDKWIVVDETIVLSSDDDGDDDEDDGDWQEHAPSECSDSDESESDSYSDSYWDSDEDDDSDDDSVREEKMLVPDRKRRCLEQDLPSAKKLKLGSDVEPKIINMAKAPSPEDTKVPRSVLGMRKLLIRGSASSAMHLKPEGDSGRESFGLEVTGVAHPTPAQRDLRAEIEEGNAVIYISD